MSDPQEDDKRIWDSKSTGEQIDDIKSDVEDYEGRINDLEETVDDLEKRIDKLEGEK